MSSSRIFLPKIKNSTYSHVSFEDFTVNLNNYLTRLRFESSVIFLSLFELVLFSILIHTRVYTVMDLVTQKNNELP